MNHQPVAGAQIGAPAGTMQQALPATGAFLSIAGVNKVYETAKSTTHALTTINTGVAEGEFVSVVGPSGCGKSTLMRLVAGLDVPTSGEIRLAGTPVRGPSRRTGIVFQEATLLPWRDALSNILLPADVQWMSKADRDKIRGRAEGLLKLVGLDGFAGAYPSELSGGMRQRVALARALLMDPALLLMDEPFGALDALTREQMNMELLRIWTEATKTVIFITHSVSEAVLLSDRVLVMSPRPGRISGDVRVELPRPRSLSQLETPAGIRAIAQVREGLEVGEVSPQRSSTVEL
jgi:NitT/TauT family transport system ATP-binding protein